MSENYKDSLDLSSSLPEVWKMLSDIERNLLRENAQILQFKKTN